MKSQLNLTGRLLGGLALSLITAQAAVVIDLSPGLSSPPATLGGYLMTAFADDSRANFTDVSSAPSPLGGSVGFGSTVSLREIGDGWDTWSHGYAGDVYFAEAASGLSVTLPPGTLAFYLYVQPNDWGTFEFTVSSGLTTSPVFSVDGDSGARYVGIYSTNPAEPLTGMFIENTDGLADGFAVGEFGIVPEPATAACLAGVGCLAFGAWHRRRSSQRA